MKTEANNLPLPIATPPSLSLGLSLDDKTSLTYFVPGDKPLMPNFSRSGLWIALVPCRFLRCGAHPAEVELPEDLAAKVAVPDEQERGDSNSDE